ncbi:MAG: OmpA family protein, partial [Muribaculaceae bacterium]|nr:OmpA family protein [Muribaculaceae bacterium]
MKKIIYIIMSVLVVSTVMEMSSCKTAKMKDADEKYERGEYYAAAEVYRKIYNKLNRKEDRYQRGEVAFMLGECYRHLNQSARAAASYQNSKRYEWEDSLIPFYLAQAQQMEGQYTLAGRNYKAYLDTAPNNWQAKEGIRACEMAPKWRDQDTRYIVKTARLFNSRRADFCPMFLDSKGDILYFTSSREKATGTAKSEITGTKNCDVFFSKKDDKGKWSNPEPVEGDLNTEFDEGITAFTPDGQTMFFAKALRKTDSGTSVEIYKASRSEARWTGAAKFEITADTLSAYNDPAVSTDGKWLYFSSDMPGGQGGKDLWRVMISDGHGTLENLGDQINTPGDERFPYVRNDSTLYFSSNGHAGLGGLDIFKATLQPSGKWFIQNLGAPMNSSADDFGITFESEGEKGYFSSNRKDARGYDHIYSFEKPDLKIWISGYVLDKDEEPVPNAIIRIVGNDGSNQKAVAKPDGTFRFDLQRGVSYVMLAGANGYLNGRQQFTSDIEEADAEYNVDFVLAAMTKPQVIDNIFYDYNKATLRPESKTALDSMVQVLNDNPYITIEMGAHTDRVGGDEYNLKLSDRRAKSVVDYLIAAGVDSARLQSHGYGRSVPKVITKRLARLYPQFNEGDTLNEPFVMALTKEDRAAADQINRRTEFQVLTTNYYRTFDSSIKEPGSEEAADSAQSKLGESIADKLDTKGKTPEEIERMREEAITMQKMEAEKEREKAIAEGKDLDPEGKYNGEKPGTGKSKLEGSGMISSGSSGSGSGSGSGRGSGSGSGSGSGNSGGSGTRKSSDPNATK